MNIRREIFRPILKLKAPRGSRPDFQRFRRAVTTNEPGPVTIGDIFADFEMVGNFLREPVLDWASIAENPTNITPRDLRKGFDYVEQSIRFCALNSWDYVFSFSMIPFRGMAMQMNENTSAEVARGRRGWLDDNRGPVMTWDDFERYHWPSNVDVINLMTRVVCRRVPDGMKVMVIPGGVFEWTTWLMGLVPFCYALADDPGLVDAVLGKVSGIIYRVVEALMDEPEVGGVFYGDDLGFATGTLVSPDVLRKKFFPRIKKIVDLAHSADKLFVFHSCGDMYELMDDIIEMGADAKHSFEDKIMPVEEAYRRWGGRIGIIGGVDVDIMAKGSPVDVRKRTREIIEACAPGGRFVLGTGNSVANYIPVRNYRAMVGAAKKWNAENFGTQRRR
ncbi:uroporphyrinogen decarboxylase family protein [bacterium]